MTIENDTQYEVHIVKSVEPGKGNSFVVSTDNGCLYVSNEKGLPPPMAGEWVRFYGKGFGFPVRGIEAEDKVYRYQTEEDFEAEQEKERDEMNVRRKQEWENGLPKFIQDVKDMPVAMQQRIEFFMRNPEWGWNFGPYELFCCKQAVVIAKHCMTEDAITEFHKKDWSEQIAELPELSHEHSGNTFGQACHLALCLLKHPELLYKTHGALCPLVGCNEYGCWSTTQKSEES